MKLRVPPDFPLALVLGFGIGFGVAPAGAHPGHGLDGAGVTHLLTSPYHLSVFALGGAALWFSARFIRNKLSRRVLQFLGLAALVASALLWSVRA